MRRGRGCKIELADRGEKFSKLDVTAARRCITSRGAAELPPGATVDPTPRPNLVLKLLRRLKSNVSQLSSAAGDAQVSTWGEGKTKKKGGKKKCLKLHFSVKLF